MIARAAAAASFALALLAFPARAQDPAARTGDCSHSAELVFDDAPSYRVGDPKRAEKQEIGMNPLRNKEIDIEASETMVTLRVHTHDSFHKYWDYAAKRRASGINAATAPSDQALRGEVLRFIAFPKNVMEQAVEVRVWLEYAGPDSYVPRSNVTTASEAAADMPIGPNGLRQRAAPPADASSLDVTLGLNEAEVRLPTNRFGWEADDEIFFHFRKGDAVVCIPEQD